MRKYKVNISKKNDCKILIFDDKKKYQKTYKKLAEEDDDGTYGVFIRKHKTVLINKYDIIGDEIDFISVVAHEIGHAYAYTLPSHASYDGVSAAYADAFEISMLFNDDLIDIKKKEKKFKIKKNKVKKGKKDERTRTNASWCGSCSTGHGRNFNSLPR